MLYAQELRRGQILFARRGNPSAMFARGFPSSLHEFVYHVSTISRASISAHSGITKPFLQLVELVID